MVSIKFLCAPITPHWKVLQGLYMYIYPYHRSQYIDGYGEHDGGFALGSNDVEGLQVAELHGSGRVLDGLSCLLQGPRGIQLPFSRYHLVGQHTGSNTRHSAQLCLSPAKLWVRG